MARLARQAEAAATAAGQAEEASEEARLAADAAVAGEATDWATAEAHTAVVGGPPAGWGCHTTLRDELTALAMRAAPCPDLDDADPGVEEQALTYFPPDPWNVQKRTVLADGPDGFLVVLEGLTSTYHFRSRAMRFVAEA